ncbi:hypothetical protein MTE1_5365 [Klebsiella pneumoniae JHCK1]|nr:hypothetical protein MTE1_5365 [Klebsiella pneumoniae JHCK1]
MNCSQQGHNDRAVQRPTLRGSSSKNVSRGKHWGSVLFANMRRNALSNRVRFPVVRQQFSFSGVVAHRAHIDGCDMLFPVTAFPLNFFFHGTPGKSTGFF